METDWCSTVGQPLRNCHRAANALFHLRTFRCFPRAGERRWRKKKAKDGAHSDRLRSERPFVVSFPACQVGSACSGSAFTIRFLPSGSFHLSMGRASAAFKKLFASKWIWIGKFSIIERLYRRRAKLNLERSVEEINKAGLPATGPQWRFGRSCVRQTICS